MRGFGSPAHRGLGAHGGHRYQQGAVGYRYSGFSPPVPAARGLRMVQRGILLVEQDSVRGCAAGFVYEGGGTVGEEKIRTQVQRA